MEYCRLVAHVHGFSARPWHARGLLGKEIVKGWSAGGLVRGVSVDDYQVRYQVCYQDIHSLETRGPVM